MPSLDSQLPGDAQVSTEHLAQLLTTIDYEVLKAFAEARTIEVPEGMNLEDLARLVRKSVPDLGPSLRQVIRLELRHTESTIRSQLQQLSRDVSAATDTKLAKGLEEVSVLKYVFGTIAVVVSLILLVGGLFGFFKMDDLQRLQKQLESELATRQALTRAQKTYTVTQAIDDIDGLLRRVSLSLLEDGDHRQAQHIQHLLEDLPIETSGSVTDEPDADKMIKLLRGVTTDLILLQEVTTGRDKSARVAALDKIEPRWQMKPVPSVKDEAFRFFIATLTAHRHNILGILELRRFQLTNNLTSLQTAEEAFEAARKLNPSYSRIYSNLGVAKLLRFQALARDGHPNKQELLQLLVDSRKALADARSHSEDPYSGSLTLNNLAVTYLREAQLQEDVTQAHTLLERGISALETAKALPGRDWVIFETWAQLLAERFVIETRHKAKVNRQAAVHEIINMITLAASETGGCHVYIDEKIREIKEFAARELVEAGFSTQGICR